MIKFKRKLKLLFNLLKENNLLEEFIFNYNKDTYYRYHHAFYKTPDHKLEDYLTLYIRNDKSYRIISDAFGWNHSKWGRLNDKWQLICDL
jgi:hypothetical protein